MGKALLWLSDRFFYLVLLVAAICAWTAIAYEFPDNFHTRGELVMPDEPERPPLVRMTVAPSLVRQVAPGQTAEFEPDRAAGMLSGHVYKVGTLPMMDGANEAYEVWIALPDIPQQTRVWLADRMRGNIRLQLSARSLLDRLLGRQDAAAAVDQASRALPKLPAWPLSVVGDGGAYEIAAEIADTPERLAHGLMFRRELAKDHGMLFVFPGRTVGTFWMKNTVIPLSIAFLDESGTIVGILDMEPCEAEPCARYGIDKPYVMALEMNRGWFEERQITVGDRIDTSRLPKVPNRAL